MVLPAEPHTHCLPSASPLIGVQQPAVTGAPPLASLTYDTGCSSADSADHLPYTLWNDLSFGHMWECCCIPCYSAMECLKKCAKAQI